MANVTIRPDLRTSSGEISGLYCNDQYVGQLCLVYREKEQLSGAVQLENQSIRNKDRKQVMDTVNRYIESLNDALNVQQCSVIVTLSAFDYAIAMDEGAETILEWIDPIEKRKQIKRDISRSKQLPDMPRLESKPLAEYELVIVGEQGEHTVEYHVYEGPRKWVAEALLTIDASEVSGEVNWKHEPDDHEIEFVIELLISDFDEEAIDSFHLDIIYEGQLIETVELNRDIDLEQSALEFEHSVKLIRDDGDVLTYEIFKQSTGGLPYAEATMDISNRHITGFIDLFHESDEQERELIADLLVEELENEIHIHSVSISFLYRNRLIDEWIFENEPTV